MSLREPYIKRDTNYAQRLLVRFQREVLDRGRKVSSFPKLCDMAAIPRDLRAALLQTLVLRGHVQPEGGDLVSLTAAGTQQAATVA
jgi:hypothetical protein